MAIKRTTYSLPEHGAGAYKSVTYRGFNIFGVKAIRFSTGGYKLPFFIHYRHIATHFCWSFGKKHGTISLLYDPIGFR